MSAAWIWTIVGSAAAVAALVTLIVTWRRRKRVLGHEQEIDHDIHLNYYLDEDVHHLWLPSRIFPDEAATRAAKEAIKTGLLVFNPPAEMIQGRKELVEVGIARAADLRDVLISELRGRGQPQFEEIDTSLYMEVKLSGPTFEITSHSPSEQLIIPTPAHWEFNVLPCRAGHQTITLSISMRIEAKGIVGGRRGVSVLEKQIDIRVNVNFATRRFVSNNWQWLVPVVLTLAGTVAAWLVVPF